MGTKKLWGEKKGKEISGGKKKLGYKKKSWQEKVEVKKK